MSLLEALLLALIEGLTEFIPVSSTAHLIFTGQILGLSDDDFFKMFTVSIQFGAILAVVLTYRKTFFKFSNLTLYVKLAAAVIPALVLGKLFDDKIEAVLEKPIPIACVLIVGGVVLVFIDRLFKKNRIQSMDDVSIGKSITIGFWQCLAMMPGTSRSAASIIGGMQQGLTRKMAAEFSFFLAVPTMLAVTLYSVFLKDWGTKAQKGYEMILADTPHLLAFIVGNAVAFLVAYLAIKFFLDLLQKYGFKVWGYYRIVVGSALLFYFMSR